MYRREVLRVIYDQIGPSSGDPDVVGRKAIMDVVALFPISSRIGGRGRYHAVFGHAHRYRVIGAALSRGMSPYVAERIFTNVPGMSEDSKRDVRALIARNVAGIYGENDPYLRRSEARAAVATGGPIVFTRGGPGAGYRINSTASVVPEQSYEMTDAERQRMHNTMQRRLANMDLWLPIMAGRLRERRRREAQKRRREEREFFM